MTMQQTVEIPDNHWLTLELPQEVPVGKAILAFTITPVPKSNLTQDEANAKLCGFLKDRGITMECFEEMQREDLLLENEIDDRTWK